MVAEVNHSSQKKKKNTLRQWCQKCIENDKWQNWNVIGVLLATATGKKGGQCSHECGSIPLLWIKKPSGFHWLWTHAGGGFDRGDYLLVLRCCFCRVRPFPLELDLRVLEGGINGLWISLSELNWRAAPTCYGGWGGACCSGAGGSLLSSQQGVRTACQHLRSRNRCGYGGISLHQRLKMTRVSS